MVSRLSGTIAMLFLFNLVFLSLFFCVRNGNWFLKVVLTLSVVLVLLFRFEGVMPFYGTTNFEQG